MLSVRIAGVKDRAGAVLGAINGRQVSRCGREKVCCIGLE